MHEGLLTAFVIVTALAVVIQAAILFAMYQALRELREAVIRIDAGIKEHLHPVLRSLGGMLTAAREPVSVVLSNVADISGVLRDRTHAADVLAAEVLDRFRAQVVRFDELLIGLTQKVQRAGDTVERSVLVPVREMSALLVGLRRGVEVFLGRPRRTAGERAKQEEELFI
jgi:hypothetical protein